MCVLTQQVWKEEETLRRWCLTVTQDREGGRSRNPESMPGVACPTVAPGSTEPHGRRTAAQGRGNIQITGRGEVLFTPWYGKKPHQNYTQKTPSRLYTDAGTPAKDQMLPLASGHDFTGGAAGAQTRAGWRWVCWTAGSGPPARLPGQPSYLSSQHGSKAGLFSGPVERGQGPNTPWTCFGNPSRLWCKWPRQLSWDVPHGAAGSCNGCSARCLVLKNPRRQLCRRAGGVSPQVPRRGHRGFAVRPGLSGPWSVTSRPCPADLPPRGRLRLSPAASV